VADPIDILMPQLGETVTEGTISVWFKQVGDDVSAGENLFEIETDKTSMEIQATSSGVLTDILASEGETVPVGTKVAIIGGDGTAAPAPVETAPAPDPEPAPAPPAPAAAPPTGYESPAPDSAAKSSGFDQGDPYSEVRTPVLNYGPADVSGIKFTPLARRLIAERGLDAPSLAAQAKAQNKARVAKADVLAAAQAGPAPAAAAIGLPQAPPRPPIPADATEMPLNKIRQVSATHLASAWVTIPHVLQAVEVDFHNVEQVRGAHKGRFKQDNGISLTYLAFIARAVCIAIKDYPQVNARFETDKLIVHNGVNLGIAVDLARDGLIVPVIRQADGMTVKGLARAIAEAASRARDGKLTPDDLAGGTYTLSNSGTFGTMITAPIVNPPQVAILSTDGIHKKPVVVESAAGDAIAIRPIGILAQSFDHRGIDGAYSAAFLARVRQELETRDWARELE
jgi:2-oxoglutarate dehydrogenase E2 component (dihydrolipoamide succinyltransferase)